MPWVRLDDSLADDPRVTTAGVSGAGLLALALAYSNRNLTDGWIPAALLERLAGDPAVLKASVQARIFTAQGRDELPGFAIHEDYTRLQPSRLEVESRRRQKAAAGRVGGRASGVVRAKQTPSTNAAGVKQAGSAAEAETERPASTPPAASQQNRSPVPDPDPQEQKSTGALAQAPIDNKATRGQLCSFFHEVWDRETNRTDRMDAVKHALSDRRMTATEEAIRNAEAEVAKLRGVAGSGARSRVERNGGFAQVAEAR